MAHKKILRAHMQLQLVTGNLSHVGCLLKDLKVKKQKKK